MQSYQQLTNFYEARILATLFVDQLTESKKRLVTSKGQVTRVQDDQIQVQLKNGYQTQFSLKNITAHKT